MAFTGKAVSISQVVPGNDTVLKLPTGAGAPTYDQILLELSGGLLPSHIKKITGNANGEDFYQAGSMETWEKHQDYRGLANLPTKFLVLDFTEKKARNGATEQLWSSIPGQLLQSLSFAFEISEDAPAGGKLSAEMVYRPPTTNPMILKQRRATEHFSGGGDQLIQLKTGNAGSNIKRMYIHEETPGTITGVELRIGNRVAWESSRARMEHFQERNDMVPQPGLLVLDFVLDGNMSGMLPTKGFNSVDLTLKSTAGNAYIVYYESVDPI